MKMKKHIKVYHIAVYILSIAFAFNLMANESTSKYNKYFHFGGYLHYLMNKHTAEFSTLSDCASCNPGFTGGFGNGFAVGGLIEFPLTENILSLGVRAGYSMRNSDFFQNEVIGNALSKGIVAPNVTDVTVEYSLFAKLSTVDLEPYINYNFWNNFRLSLGLKGALFLSKTFSQKEKIISPSGIVFNDTKTIERNVYEDKGITKAKKILTYVTPALSYDFRLSSGLAIAPEVKLELPLYSITSTAWMPMAINFGVSVRMPHFPGKPTRDTIIYIRDTSDVQSETIAEREVIKLKETNTTESVEELPDYYLATKIVTESYERILPKFDDTVPKTSLAVYSLDEKGKKLSEVETVELIIEEIATEESFPLLPQIFFPQNSSELSSTRLDILSNAEVSNFDEQNLEWNTLSIYYNLLNIVGYRMSKNPSAKLEITGCNNDIDEEKGNTALSKARAEVVRNYLHQTWGIAPNRLIVKSRNLPERYSNNSTDDGKEENRRVELSSSNAELLKPLTLMEIHKTATPPIVRIQPAIESESPLEQILLEIEQKGTEIRKFLLMNSYEPVDWIVEAKPIPDLEAPVNIHLTATARNGQVGKTTKSIKVEQRTIQKKKYEMMNDKRIERYSLILFDFNKTNITPQHRESIKLVKSRIQPNSTISVIGYTDRMGNPEYNMQLSRERASNVAKQLGANPELINIIGKGGESFLYDNNLPEGRSYNRTVRINVETPIENK